MSDIASAFGTHELRGIKHFFHRLALAVPNNWLGQRLAYIFRKIVLYDRSNPIIDARIWGLNLRLYPLDNVTDRFILFLGKFFDREERKFIREVLEPGSIFLDVGSNSGIYSLLAAQVIDQGKILAFEPHPIMHQRLKKNVASNTAIDKIKTLEYGIADKNAVFEMSINPTNLGGNSIQLTHTDKEEYLEKRIQIKCRVLLEVLKEEHIDHIDFLKIDIEEAEHLALVPFYEKAPRTLFPKYVMIETDEKIDFEKYGYHRLMRTKNHNSIYMLN